MLLIVETQALKNEFYSGYNKLKFVGGPLGEIMQGVESKYIL